MHINSSKSIGPNKFSPCRAVLERHIKRAWFIAKLPKTAFLAYSVSENSPLDYGWRVSECNSYLETNWFEGDQVPPEIESFEETSMSNEEILKEYYEDSEGNIHESDESDIDDGSNYDDF